MKNFKIIVLLLSGLALFYASWSRLISPTTAVFLQTFFENPDNSLDVTIDLANEVRGVGAVLFLGGIAALVGTRSENLRLTSFVVTTVVFGGIVIGRSLSIFIDGIPPSDLVRVAVIEGVLSLLNLFCLVHILIQHKTS